MRGIAGRLLAVAAVASTAAAQDAHRPPSVEPPFAVGERLVYDVRFRQLRVGQAELELLEGEEVRGHPTWLARIRIRGGVPFYRVNDVMESWIEPEAFVSMRFRENIDEGSHERKRTFEIFGERGMYRQDTLPEVASVAEPLDEAAFLYFVRTIPLEVGKTYEFNRYFRPDRNPVIVKVLSRDTVRVPAGTFATLQLQPIIKTRGLFSEQGDARIWLTDDSRRMMVQLKSKSRIGSLNLFLKSHQPTSPVTK
jgi:hypothetical protein